MKLRKVLLAIALIVMVNSIMKVKMPTCSVRVIGEQSISYNMGNFGHIPYDTTLKGEISLPHDRSLKMCKKDEAERIKSDDIHSFMLVERGDCKFTKKIINSQKLNHSLVIIYDNESHATPTTVMANDGHGHLVDIPSIFITKGDGEKIIRAY